MVGRHLQDFFQYQADAVIGHLLHVHIRRTEECHVAVALRHVQQTVEQLQHTGRVTAVLLALANNLSHQCHTVVCRGILVEQHTLYHAVGIGRVLLVVIVGQQRHLRIAVRRLFLQHLVIDGYSPFLLSVDV